MRNEYISTNILKHVFCKFFCNSKRAENKDNKDGKQTAFKEIITTFLMYLTYQIEAGKHSVVFLYKEYTVYCTQLNFNFIMYLS